MTRTHTNIPRVAQSLANARDEALLHGSPDGLGKVERASRLAAGRTAAPGRDGKTPALNSVYPRGAATIATGPASSGRNSVRVLDSEYPRGVWYGRHHGPQRSLIAVTLRSGSARWLVEPGGRKPEGLSVQTAGTGARVGERSRARRLQQGLLAPRLRRESGGVTPTAQMTRVVGRKRAEVQGSAPIIEGSGRLPAQFSSRVGVMTFHVGQKVICVRDNWEGRAKELRLMVPRVGVEYVIRSICTDDPSGTPALRFHRLINPIIKFGNGHHEPCFEACRTDGVLNFRPVAGRKTDISILTRMLTPNDTDFCEVPWPFFDELTKPHDDRTVIAPALRERDSILNQS